MYQSTLENDRALEECREAAETAAEEALEGALVHLRAEVRGTADLVRPEGRVGRASREVVLWMYGKGEMMVFT